MSCIKTYTEAERVSIVDIKNSLLPRNIKRLGFSKSLTHGNWAINMSWLQAAHNFRPAWIGDSIVDASLFHSVP